MEQKYTELIKELKQKQISVVGMTSILIHQHGMEGGYMLVRKLVTKELERLK